MMYIDVLCCFPFGVFFFCGHLSVEHEHIKVDRLIAGRLSFSDADVLSQCIVAVFSQG